MKRALLVVFVAACKTASSSAPEGGDLSVPKMPPDSGASSSASVDPVAVVKANAASHGWRSAQPLHQPEYVESEQLASELQAAARAHRLAVATVDEVIEECSSMGGTHFLLKTDLGLVHFGEHGAMLPLGPKKDEVVVVAFETLAAPESIEKKAFCVPARTVVARATVVLGVAQRRDGERLVADLAS
jgi:hypothetical protein